jgi:hypothetical protein
MRWLASNTFKFGHHNWGEKSMGRVVGLVFIAFVAIQADGSLILDYDFMMGIFGELQSELPEFNTVVGCLYSVQYKSIFGTPDKVRCNTCDKDKLLSQVLGVEPNTSSGYKVAEPPHHHQIIIGMQDCIPT